MPNPITEQRLTSASLPSESEPEVEKQPIQLDSFTANSFFALFDDRRTAEAAAQRLQDAGVEAADVEVFAGSDGAARLRPQSEAAGLLDQIVQMAQELSDFKTFVEGCSAAVGGGKVLLVARFEDEAGRTAIEATVRQSGGAPLAYTDNWTLIKYA